jgi:SPP1 family predicted phage head-tail adaptor
VTGDWKTYAAVWASVESLRSGERYRAQQVVAELSHRVLIRWRDGVEHNHRLLWNGRILEVSQMITRRVQNEIEFLCTEKAA